MSFLGRPGQNLLSAFKAMQVGSIGEALIIPRQQGAGMLLCICTPKQNCEF
jgi:hypothetical protein